MQQKSVCFVQRSPWLAWVCCISGCVSACVALPANGVHNVRSDTHLLSSEYILICSQTYSLDAKSARVFRAFSLAVESKKKKNYGKCWQAWVAVRCWHEWIFQVIQQFCASHTLQLWIYIFMYTHFLINPARHVKRMRWRQKKGVVCI